MVLKDSDSPPLCAAGSSLHHSHRRRLLGFTIHVAHGWPHAQPGWLWHARRGGRHARHVARVRAAPTHGHGLPRALPVHGAAGVRPQAVVVHARAWPAVAGVGRSAVIGRSRVVTWEKGKKICCLLPAKQFSSREVRTVVVLFNGSAVCVIGVQL